MRRFLPNPNRSSARPNRQRGSALIVSLGALTAITVAATVAMQQSTLQVRMVTNMKVKEETRVAASSYLDTAFSSLQMSSTSILSSLKQNGGTISPYTAYTDWKKPDLDLIKSVDQVQVTMQYASDQVTTNKGNTTDNCLICNEGDSGSVSTNNPFYITSTASDRSGNITSSVRLGILVKGAASN